MKKQAPVSKPQAKRPTIANTFHRDWQLWVLILPAIIVIFIFNYIPMYGVQIAFRDYDFSSGFTGGNWAGLKYFRQFFASPMFWPVIRNTFVIAGTSILFGFPAPLFLALLFNQIRNARAKKTLQTVVYMPHFISTVVMVSLIRVFLSPNSGLISNLLKGLGLIAPSANLLGDPGAFVPVYVLTNIWQNCGWDSIIYLAALSTIDSQLYEAARIDGASRLKMILHIDLPSIVPTIVILLIMNAGNILNVGFEKVFLMQSNMNQQVSEVISTYVYRVGLLGIPQFSYGAAIGLFNTLVNFVFLIIVNTMAKKMNDISLW